MSAAEDLVLLSRLRDQGVLTEAEFQAAKTRALAPPPSGPTTPTFEAPPSVAVEGPSAPPTAPTVEASAPPASHSKEGKHGVVTLVAVLCAVLFALVIVAAVSSGKTASTATTTPAYSYTPPPPLKVVYKLTGSTSQASITYQTPTGSSQQSDIDVPMQSKSGGEGLSYTGFSRGDFLYLSAQNSGEYGSLTCTIEVDGVAVSSNTASGAYAIAQCSGQA